MTAIIVIGCILLFFAVLLFSPIVLRFSSRNGAMSFKLRYIFFIVDLSPEKLEKRKTKRAERLAKKESKKKKPKEEAQPAEEKKKKKAAVTMKTIWSYVKASKKGLDAVCRHVVIYKIKATIIAGGGDAAQIAKNYAAYCMIASNGLSVLDTLFDVKEPDIYIQPDFLREKTLFELAFRVRILPWFLLLAGVNVFSGILKIMRENKQQDDKIKGGKDNERNERHKQRDQAASYK